MNLNIYKASAGSGKTYTLVKEYIKKLLSNKNNNPHRELLAITFTNKASSEMKTRIISTLYEFSKVKHASSYDSIYNTIKLELAYSDEQLIIESKKALSQILHSYSFFSVSTIDKFIYKIIKGFSYELELPSNFEVELDKDNIIQEGVMSLLDEIGFDTQLTNKLLAYSDYKTNQDKNWDIQEDLLQVSKELFKDQKFIFINELMDLKSISLRQKELIKSINQFEKSILNYQKNLSNLIQGIPASVFPYKALPTYIQKLKRTPFKELEISITTNKRIYNSLINNVWAKKTASINEKNQINQISNTLNSSLNNLIKYIDANYPIYRFNKKCYSSLFLVSVLGRIDQKIASIKQENNIIHISEFNQIIFRFLMKNSVPFIYEKIGTRYNHYFIDEFQDTSIMQWRNLFPLVEESVSKGGSCLIVGDGKQAIYRWRGGDVEQFLEICDSNRQGVASLNTNYRSGKEIVNFNNEFFKFLSKKLTGNYNRLYNKLDQKSAKNLSGFIELSFLDEKGQTLDSETLKLICEKVKDTVNDGYLYKDISILTRNNKEITKIAAFLTENDIPIISSESLLIKHSLSVEFLLNNLLIIQNQSDHFAKANLLEYLINNNMIMQNKISVHQFISENSQTTNKEFQHLLNQFGFNFYLEKLTNINLYELVERLIRIFSLNKKDNIYINFFLDFVFEFSTRFKSSITDFLYYWDQKKDTASIIIPEGINAIEIMSIHKSKGLQFPVVIFPFANWKDDLGKDQKWFNVSSFFTGKKDNEPVITLLPLKQEIESWPKPFPQEYVNHKIQVLLDNINLLYVAMTRPEDRLYIISNLDSRRGNIYHYFLEFLTAQKNASFVENNFQSGEKLTSHTKISPVQNPTIKNIVSIGWRNRLRIRKNHVINKNVKQKYSIVWGDLIHKIMAGINTKDDIDKMLDHLEVETKYSLEIYNKIKNQILRIINSDKISHLFQVKLKIYSETSILSEDGQIYRPDRVVVNNNIEASLIDYKTGKKHASHKQQMHKYEEVLIKLKFKKVHKYIVYLTDGDIIEVK